MAGAKGRSGGRRRGAGRKAKADEQTLIENLSPYEDRAHAVLFEAIDRGEPWAIKLFFAYRYGKPKQIQDITMTGGIKVTPISFLADLTDAEIEAELARLEAAEADG